MTLVLGVILGVLFVLWLVYEALTSPTKSDDYYSEWWAQQWCEDKNLKFCKDTESCKHLGLTLWYGECPRGQRFTPGELGEPKTSKHEFVEVKDDNSSHSSSKLYASLVACKHCPRFSQCRDVR